MKAIDVFHTLIYKLENAGIECERSASSYFRREDGVDVETGGAYHIDFAGPSGKVTMTLRFDGKNTDEPELKSID